MITLPVSVMSQYIAFLKKREIEPADFENCKKWLGEFRGRGVPGTVY
jgi:hypothetical protein